MSKQRKKEKNIIEKWKNTSNETLLFLLKEEIKQQIILNKTIEILNKYNINTSNKNYKNQKIYTSLIELANLRKLEIPKELYNQEITEHDIISKINELKNNEIIWINKHNYLLDAFYEENLPNKEDLRKNSEEKILQITYVYENIIEKEFNQKKLIKTK